MFDWIFLGVLVMLSGVVYWLIHNSRKAPRKRQQARQAEIRRKLHQGTQDD